MASGTLSGLPVDHYITLYKSKKEKKRKDVKEWLENDISGVVPDHLVRNCPELHPATNFKRVRTEEPRKYGSKGNSKASKGEGKSKAL